MLVERLLTKQSARQNKPNRTFKTKQQQQNMKHTGFTFIVTLAGALHPSFRLVPSHGICNIKRTVTISYRSGSISRNSLSRPTCDACRL